MILKRLSASFGKLRDASLELREGLNIIEAPNEAGKSTWLSFLFAMLYGLDTRSRDKKEQLADKNRYAPWSGAPMQGVLECSVSGRDITIERRTLRSNSPMGQFSARYTGTADSVPGLTAENAGQWLLGVPREVYERSALIRQSGLSVDHHVELERRILALVSTGEETSSYTEVNGRLRDWQRKRRFNKTGLLPRLEAELERLGGAIDGMYRINAQAAQDRAALEEWIRKRESLASARDAYRRLDARGNWVRLSRAETERDEAASHLADLKRNLGGAAAFSREQLLELRRALSGLGALRASLSEVEKMLAAASLDLADAEERVNASPFAGMGPDAAWEAAQADLREYAHWQKRASFGKIPLFLWSVALLAVSAVSVYMALSGSLSFWMPAVPLALLAGGDLLLLWLGKTEQLRAKSAMILLVHRYSAADSSLFLEQAARYREDFALLEQRRVMEKQLESNCASLTAQYSEKRKDIMGGIRRLDPSADSDEAAELAVAAALDGWDRLEAASVALKNAGMVYEALKSSLPSDAPPPGDDPAPPEISREAVEASFAEAETEIRRLTVSLASAQGRLQAVGDPAALEAERDALNGRGERLLTEYDAISLALTGMEEANGLLRARFSPPLNEKAGKIMGMLTGGKYDRLYFDKDFSAAAVETGEAQTRSALSLSQGTLDQLYLALRLAVSALVLPSEKKAPLLMDDALANFDDRRMGYALDCLLEEAKNRQVVLFTCHSREAAAMENRSGVHILRLTEWSRP